MKGRITVLKSLAIPKLQYLLSCLPIPNEVLKNTEQVISNFIWNCKRPKVKKHVIMQEIENGGIKAPDY